MILKTMKEILIFALATIIPGGWLAYFFIYHS